MKWWEIVNSPVSITAISMLWGSIAASWITFMWQKRAQRHAARVECAQTIVAGYQEYVRLLRGKPEGLDGKEFDSLHVRMLSQTKIAAVLFRDKRVGIEWRSALDRLATVRGLRLAGREDSVEEKMDGVYQIASGATERMFKEIS